MEYIREKYSFSISCIRVVATLLIVLCHVVQEYNNPVLAMTGQIFNVGVIIFFFMSGFLYGDKKIINVGKWISNRFVRLMLPIYIFLVYLLIIFLFQKNTISIKVLLIQVLNLQGITNTYFLGLGHLWFVTVIMICYLLVPIIYKINEKDNSLNLYKFLFVSVALIILQIILSFTLDYHLFAIYLVYIYVYFLGYYSKKIKWINLVKYTNVFLIVALVSILVRFGLRYVFDGFILYDNIIVPYTQSVFGISLFYYMFFFFYKIKEKNSKNNITMLINKIDTLSYDIYISHYIYCVGPLAIIGFVTSSYLIDTLLFIIVTLFTSIILHSITLLINKKLLTSKKERIE